MKPLDAQAELEYARRMGFNVSFLIDNNTRPPPLAVRTLQEVAQPIKATSARTSSSPILSTLPLELLVIIEALTNERTIWALRATCRALREAGEEAIKPYLAEQTIAARPRFMLKRYQAIEYSTYTKSKDARLEELRNINDRFSRHLSANPASASHLRNLTLEFEDYFTCGWSLLEQFLHQLETLTIHSINAPHLRNNRLEPATLSDAIARRWFLLFDQIPILSFPNLTILSIHATFGSLRHFQQIARYTPNLRNLLLGDHWTDRHFTELDPPTDISRPLLVNLSLAGPTPIIAQAVGFLKTCAPNIRQLTISVHLDVVIPEFGVRRFLDSAATWAKLKDLAIYGQAAGSFLADIKAELELARHRTWRVAFHEVESLKMEQIRRPGQAHYWPPLEQNYWPYLPALKHLSLVREAYIPTIAEYIFTSAKAGDYYQDDQVRALFNHYPDLRQVQWVSGYPLDSVALNENESVKRANGDVACIVDRPETDLGGRMALFRPTYPRGRSSGQESYGARSSGR